MSLPLKLNFSDYDNFLTEPNYTTSAEAQDYFRNMDMLVEALIDVGLWQPETNYPNGHVVFSPNMPNGAEAVCVATNGGKSSNTEPSWGEVGGDNVSDGTCFWKLRWKHWSKENATNRLPNTTYAVGDVMLHKSNLSVAIKCTTAGTTSNTELDISSNNVGDTVTDGSVAWKVIARSNILDETGATTASQALANLGGLSKNGGAYGSGAGYVASDDNNYFRLYGGTGFGKGAGLLLSGKDHEILKGGFQIYATNDTTSSVLDGKADGTLTWGGKNIVFMPNYRAGVEFNSVPYTAPADGYIFIRVAAGSDAIVGKIYINNALVARESNAEIQTLIPVSKGDTLTGEGLSAFQALFFPTK